jgi:acyl-CoA thioesterase FadM
VNLFLRLLWLALSARSRPRVPLLGPCRTPFRVLPTDLDVLRHVNNGVYLSMMDLARVDLMMRAAIATRLRPRGWYPVVVAATIQFRCSLRLLQRFEIETRVLTWDDRAFLVEQRFLRGEQPVAHALVRARFLSRDGQKVTPVEVLALADNPSPPPAPPDWAIRWNAEQSTWRGGGAEASDAKHVSARTGNPPGVP